MKTPCSYGRMKEGDTYCEYLIVDNEKIGTFTCSIKDKIEKMQKNTPYPMFGCGCSSSLFNTVRNNVMNKQILITSEAKIISSLKAGKMIRCGQSLRTLSKVAFGVYDETSKKKTQKILYKLKKEYKVQYYKETKVWYFLGEAENE